MFDKTARWYDQLYEQGLGKDYGAEAAMVADLLPDAQTLLDVACGTGLHLHVDLPDLKMTRMSSHQLDADGCSNLDFHYLVGTPEGVEHMTEHHVLGLFTWEQYRDAFERAGLSTTVEVSGGPMGRGMLTGVKPR